MIFISKLNFNGCPHLGENLLACNESTSVFFLLQQAHPSVSISFPRFIGCSAVVLSNSFVCQSIPYIATCLTGDSTHQHLLYTKTDSAYLPRALDREELRSSKHFYFVSSWPAAHPRGARGWRRSGDESSLGSFVSQEETLPRSSDFSCAPRPQSAIEGGQLDIWLEYLRTMPSKVRSPIHNPSFDNQTASEGQTPGRAWRQMDLSFSTASSSCGSSPSSQESLQTMWFPSPEHRRAWEKAHIMQSPSKEQTQLSCLAPVKIGWLPIQRRAMLVGNACSQKQHLNKSSGQVRHIKPVTNS
ncbi:hypothetical protein XENOCAPTIV_002834 [Xenoophorus captivus]|uniref:Uncharacterized protein n=1 Tax=Xenoophorus captivus TaxID=1517983 RepID=A0ABV0QG30_9TELE